jgi:acetoacetate decarboxylase
MERLFSPSRDTEGVRFPPVKGTVGRLREMLALGDYIYRDAHYLACEIEVDRDRAARWVPWPLRLARDATATLFTAWFPETTFGSVYREAGLLLHVTHLGRPAVYSPWMIVDDDVALILGREALGYPKKLGEIDFVLDGDRVHAVARRRGAELVRMVGTLGRRLENAPPILGRPHRNVRTMLGLTLPLLVAFTPKERVVEVREAKLEVTIGGSERDPLRELGFGAIRTARLHRVDLAAAFPPLPVGIPSPRGLFGQLLTRIL